jgi:hypothetical protein
MADRTSELIDQDERTRAPGASPDPPTSPPPRAAASPWAPFRHRAFAVIWTATVVSNVGGWMYNVASGWLMTSLDPDPFIEPRI